MAIDKHQRLRGTLSACNSLQEWPLLCSYMRVQNVRMLPGGGYELPEACDEELCNIFDAQDAVPNGDAADMGTPSQESKSTYRVSRGQFDCWLGPRACMLMILLLLVLSRLLLWVRAAAREPCCNCGLIAMWALACAKLCRCAARAAGGHGQRCTRVRAGYGGDGSRTCTGRAAAACSAATAAGRRSVSSGPMV